MIALAKFLHIGTLVVWCAGLIALPVLLHLYRGARRQRRWSEFRLLTHTGYTLIATPAAVIAIAAGTVLIFAEGVFEPWLLAKLALVAGMTLIHAWLGHLILQSGERGPEWKMPPPLIGLAIGLPLMLGVLALVLVKPELRGLETLLPGWALEPQEFAL